MAKFIILFNSKKIIKRADRRMSVISKFKLFYKIPSRRLLHVDDILGLMLAQKSIDFTHIPVKCALRNFELRAKSIAIDFLTAQQCVVDI